MIHSQPMLKKTMRIRRGLKVLSVKVRLHVDDVAADYNKAQGRLADTEKLLQKNASEASMNEYGEAVINLFCVLFGEKDTERIIKFYEGRYIEMLADIYPWIQDNILPALRNPFQKALDKYMGRK
ncbi:MAG: hypothetical protein Q4D04_06215 [Clostridia bacterium]|nr:hypothetical protein [Clostridia bacterium]